MFDCHVHTSFSTDSTMDIEDAIDASKELGIGIIITDHIDYKYHVSGEFIFNPDHYFREYEPYKNDKFLLGVEMGLRDDCIIENEKLKDSYPFDFIIGSLHAVEGLDLYYKDYYIGKNKKEAYGGYLKAMLSSVKHYGLFDSLGHMDYITRYSGYEDKGLYYSDFANLIDEILKGLSHTGKAIEINTRKIDNKDIADNFIEILKRFKELGGEHVTIGSDAHEPEDIGINFKRAKEIADICNLKPVYYKERKPYSIRW